MGKGCARKRKSFPLWGLRATGCPACFRVARVSLFFGKILDMGAGPGIIGIAVTAAHPSLECIVFDQPAVCKVANEVVCEYGMENRITVKSGDYMQDDIGSGYEFVMANFTLNFLSRQIG